MRESDRSALNRLLRLTTQSPGAVNEQKGTKEEGGVDRKRERENKRKEKEKSI